MSFEAQAASCYSVFATTKKKTEKYSSGKSCIAKRENWLQETRVHTWLSSDDALHPTGILVPQTHDPKHLEQPSNASKRAYAEYSWVVRVNLGDSIRYGSVL